MFTPQQMDVWQLLWWWNNSEILAPVGQIYHQLLDVNTSNIGQRVLLLRNIISNYSWILESNICCFESTKGPPVDQIMEFILNKYRDLILLQGLRDKHSYAHENERWWASSDPNLTEAHWPSFRPAKRGPLVRSGGFSDMICRTTFVRRHGLLWCIISKMNYQITSINNERWKCILW